MQHSMAVVETREPLTSPPPAVIVHDSIEAARPGWDALLARMPERPVFARPVWAEAWLEGHHRVRRPQIVEVRSGNDVIAVAPLMLTRIPVLGLRTLEFIGGAAPTLRQWLQKPGHAGQSFHNDLLVAPEHAAPAVRALREWLEREAAWDVIRLTCVPDRSPLRALFSALPPAWSPESRRQLPTAVNTAQGWQAYRNALSARQRRHLRYEPNALERAAGGGLVHTTARGSDINADLVDQFVDLVQRRWAAAGHAGLQPDEERLVRVLARAPASGAVMHRLEAGGRLLAAHLGFDDGTRYILYHLGFEPSFTRQSPSQVLMQRVIQQCCEDSHQLIDLAAIEDASAWSAQPYARWTLSAVRPGAGSRLRAGVRRVVERGIEAASATTPARRARTLVARALIPKR